MTLLSTDAFTTQFVTRQLNKLSTVSRLRSVDDFELPENAIIHYVSDSDQVLGITKSNDMIRSTSDVYTYHVDALEGKEGHYSKSETTLNALITKYHQFNLGIKRINNLSSVLEKVKQPIVVNYSMLPSLYKYTVSSLSVYYEWLNIRTTIWHHIKEIGSDKLHFIVYKIPEVLITKNDLNKYAHNFKPDALELFTDINNLNLLELWRMLGENNTTLESEMDELLLSKVHIVFIESRHIGIFTLKSFIDWGKSDGSKAKIEFYNFLDNLIAKRSNLESEKLIKEAGEEPEQGEINNDKIHQLINEKAENGLLSTNEKKALLKLSEKHKTVIDPVTGLTLDKIAVKNTELVLKKKPLIKDNNTIFDKSMLYSSIRDLDKQYIEEGLLHRHMIESVMMLHPAGVIVKDMRVKDKMTAATKATVYSFSLQPINGPSSTITFPIPKINPDGTFLAGGVLYRMDKQHGEMPIAKIKHDTVKLTSYYGTIFINRSESTVTNLSKWIVNALVKLTKAGSVTNLVYGITTKFDKNLPRQYTAIMKSISRFNYQTTEVNYSFYFTYSKLSNFFSETEIAKFANSKLVGCGRNEKTGNLLVMDELGDVIELQDNSPLNLGKIQNILSDTGGPIEYTEMGLLNRRIPVIMAMCYVHGFTKILSELKVPLVQHPAGTRVPYKPKTYVLKFKDVVIELPYRNVEEELLFGGFMPFRKDLINFRSGDLNKRTAYSNLLSGNGLSTYHFRELLLMWDMYIDPITAALLRETDAPTDIFNVILAANRLLINDAMPDYTTVRYKGYERLCGFMYKELIGAVKAHRAKGALSDVGITIKPNGVWLNILEDQSIVLVEQSNPIHNLKEQESFTHAGAGGKSAITMVAATRGFKDSDLGVVSEATPDSAKVGIRAMLTPNANIVNLLGMVKQYEEDKDGISSVISTTAMLAPGITHDDGKRWNFNNVQMSHGVAAIGYQPLPYRTGYEQTIANRVSDLFATVATGNGFVSEIKSSGITITYDDGSSKTYFLGVKHGIVSGSTIPHHIVTHLNKNDKVIKDQVICYNDGFFTTGELDPKSIIYKHGVICRIALAEDSDTLEDGCVISKGLADKLLTPTSEVYGIVCDFSMAIHNLVTIGQRVTPETILCILEHSYEGAAEKDSDAIWALSQLSNISPKCKVYGTVSDIEVVYFGKLEDMSPSLAEVVRHYDAIRNRNVKTYSLNEAKSGEIDETIRVSGKKLIKNQAAIKIYVDYILDMGDGDKIVIGHPLKTTISRVDINPMTTDDGVEVDALFGAQSVSARIVKSAEICGLSNEVMCKLSVDFGEMVLKLNEGDNK